MQTADKTFLRLRGVSPIYAIRRMDGDNKYATVATFETLAEAQRFAEITFKAKVKNYPRLKGRTYEIIRIETTVVEEFTLSP